MKRERESDEEREGGEKRGDIEKGECDEERGDG